MSPIERALLNFLKWLALLPLRLLGAIFRELGGQAKAGAKKHLKQTFAPLLWPIVGIVTLYLIYLVGGNGALETALMYGIAIALALYGIKFLAESTKPKKPKKKKP